ncbi:MAG: hypothetical protein IIA72_19665 [Proteobacteria bacterium]|nr:hypothetical protein [Pseudomonadota bacterium]
MVRGRAVANILEASRGEASMMARCTGKTKLHNLEPEDLRALTLATAEATEVLLVGKHWLPARLGAGALESGDNRGCVNRGL